MIRLSIIVSGVLLLFPAVSRAQATAGLNPVGSWMLVSTAPNIERTCYHFGNHPTKQQMVLVFTANGADSLGSWHCKEWKDTKESDWDHSGMHWRVVQDTLVWWSPEVPEIQMKCLAKRDDEHLTLTLCASVKMPLAVPSGVYQRADSVRLE